MINCPLCNTPIGNKNEEASIPVVQTTSIHNKMSKPEKKLTWEIISLALLSCIIVTVLVNFIINGNISWSEYPIAICLITFSYISLFAFLNHGTFLKLTLGFLLASALLLLLDILTNGISWSVQLALPLLFFGTIITMMIIQIIKKVKYKGVNLIGYGLIAASIFCLGIDAVISKLKAGAFDLNWSLIVMVCAIPVALVLFFIHYRLKRGRRLERTFHI